MSHHHEQETLSTVRFQNVFGDLNFFKLLIIRRDFTHFTSPWEKLTSLSNYFEGEMKIMLRSSNFHKAAVAVSWK